MGTDIRNHLIRQLEECQSRYNAELTTENKITEAIHLTERRIALIKQLLDVEKEEALFSGTP